MNYTHIYNSRNPGLIILLIDQTAKTEDIYKDGQWIPDMLADLANDALSEIFIRCVQGNEIKNKCYVSVISYGSSCVSVISEGYIQEYEKYYSPVQKEIDVCGEKTIIETGKIKVLDPQNEGWINAEEVFEEVEQYLECWKKHTIEENYKIDHVPIIIHIGTSVICDHVIENVNRICKMDFNDGNPVIINFIYNPGSMHDTCLEYTQPSDKEDALKRIYEMSSAVDSNLAADYETYKFFEEHPNFKFFFVNPEITPQQLISRIFKNN